MSEAATDERIEDCSATARERIDRLGRGGKVAWSDGTVLSLIARIDAEKARVAELEGAIGTMKDVANKLKIALDEHCAAMNDNMDESDLPDEEWRRLGVLVLQAVWAIEAAQKHPDIARNHLAAADTPTGGADG